MTKSRRSAMALPLVLWSIAFLAGLVVLVAGAVGDWLTEEARAERVFRARQMALSGVAIGLNPAIRPGNPLLRRGSKETEGFEVRLSDEAGKINPNYWIAKKNREIFNRLFASWGVSPARCDAAIDGLTDWIDADDFRSPAGAERGELFRRVCVRVHREEPVRKHSVRIHAGPARRGGQDIAAAARWCASPATAASS